MDTRLLQVNLSRHPVTVIGPSKNENRRPPRVLTARREKTCSRFQNCSVAIATATKSSAPAVRRTTETAGVRPLEPLGDDTTHDSQGQEPDVGHEQEPEEQPDVTEGAPVEWLGDTTDPLVKRQGMEHRRGPSPSAPPGSASPDPFDHTREDAEDESGNREEGQRTQHGSCPERARSGFSSGAHVERQSIRSGTVEAGHIEREGGRPGAGHVRDAANRDALAGVFLPGREGPRDHLGAQAVARAARAWPRRGSPGPSASSTSKSVTKAKDRKRRSTKRSTRRSASRSRRAHAGSMPDRGEAGRERRAAGPAPTRGRRRRRAPRWRAGWPRAPRAERRGTSRDRRR